MRLRDAAASISASLASPILLRLSLGRWACAEETAAFRRSMGTPYVRIPPLLRALMVVPDAQRIMQTVQRFNWLLGECGTRPDLLQARLAEIGGIAEFADLTGTIFTAWTGPPVAFLHLEKCGGVALMRWLSDLFHPHQIDPDPSRSLPPHLYHRHHGALGREVRRYPLLWGHYDLPALERLDPQRFIFTLLREPRARIVSLYDYWRSVDPRLLDPASGNFTVALAQRFGLLEFLRHGDPFLRDYLDNFYIRRLTGLYATGAAIDPLAEAPDEALDLARQALGRFGFTGITERMDESITRLARLIGATPPAQAPHANSAAENHTDPSGWFRGVSRTILTPEIEVELDRLTRLDRVLYAEARAAFENTALPSASMALT